MTLRSRLMGTAVCCALVVVSTFLPAVGQVAQGAGDGSAGNPFVLSGGGDITSYILQNQSVQLTGGAAFTIIIPQTSASSNFTSSPATVDGTLLRPGNNGYSTATNPTINYGGIISGNGSVTVTSGFNTSRSTTSSLFSGGVLVFNNNGQAWSLTGSSGGTNPSALIIDPNTTVDFYHLNTSVTPQNGAAFQTSTTVDRNVTNNGYLYSSQGNAWASINGTGVNVFQYDGGDSGNLNGQRDATYSGQSFDFNNGLRLMNYANFAPGTSLYSSDITVFYTPSLQSLAQESLLTNSQIWSINNNISQAALDLQIWRTGILNLNGVILPPTFDRGSLDPAPAELDIAASYMTGVNQGRGRTIYMTSQPTLVLGNGSPIVTNSLDPTGITNNVGIQGNAATTLYSINAFNTASGPAGEALGFDYSGTYKVDINLNQTYVTNPDGSIQITGLRSGGGVNANPAQNLYILDPNDPVFNPNGGATQANHLIFVTPVMFAGLTQIDHNAVLQLGDGTLGNYIASYTYTPPASVLDSNGQPYAPITGHYSDSNGNGVLMTVGNAGALGPNTAAQVANIAVSIVNNGQLIVDNTVGARDTNSTGASPGAAANVAAFVQMNELDNIYGTGSLDQMGNLPLTLEGNTVFSGRTDVEAGSALLLKSNPVTGATGLPNSGLNLHGVGATLDISQADPTNVIGGLTGTPGSVISLGSNALIANITTGSTFNGTMQDGGVGGGAGGSFIKGGAATLTLVGANTYTGMTGVLAGVLVNGQDDAVPTTSSLGIAGGATYDVAGYRQTVGSLSGAGTVTNSGSTASLLTVGTNNQSTLFSGVIADGAAPLGLTKVGGGTLALTGTNTYSGPTAVEGGTLLIGSPSALSAASQVTVAGGATLVMEGASQTLRSIDGAGTVSYAGAGPSTLSVGAADDSMVFDGSIREGATPLSLTKTGTGTLTLNGASSFTGLTDVQAGTLAIGDLNNPGAQVGGSAQVETGATLMGHGTIDGNLVNFGTVRPGGSIGTLSIGGNYSQDPGADLLVDVTPQASSVLSAKGHASLAGTATFLFAPGTYTNKTYSFVTAQRGVSGQFANIVYQGATPVAPYTPSVVYTARTADLVVGSGSRITPFGQAKSPPATVVVAPTNEQIFASQAFMLAETTDLATRTLLGRPGAGGAIDPTSRIASQNLSQLAGPSGVTSSTDGAAAISSAFCQMGGWLRTSGTLLTFDGLASAGFKIGDAGIIGGLDHQVGPYGTIIGAAIGDDQGRVSDAVNDHATTNIVRLGLYGIQDVGPVVLNGTVGYAYDYDTSDRATEVGPAHEAHAGGIVSGGLQASAPAQVAGLTLTPAVGIRGALINQEGFTEVLPDSVSSFAVSGTATRQTSIQPYGQINVARSIRLADGGVLTPSLSAGYAYQVAEAAAEVHLIAQDATLFQGRFANFGRATPDGSASLRYTEGGMALFIDYRLMAGSNLIAPNFAAGLRAAF